MAIFDVIAAKKAGYTDGEIAAYLAEQSQFDVAAAKEAGYSDREILQHLNRTNATPLQTFLKSAGQEVGSEIKGIYQLAGGELDTQSESLRRQMEEENPIAGALGTFVGGLVNPTTLLPGTALLKGAKGVALAGAGAGAISGALQPRYTEEDISRAASTAIGAVGGGALGGLIGVISGRFGRKVADDLVKKAVDNGATTEKEIVDSIKATTGIDDATPENLATTINQVDPVNAPKVEATPATNNVNTEAVNQVDQLSSFQDIFNRMDAVDMNASRAAKDEFTKGIDSGDFTGFINSIKQYTTPNEFGKLPLFKVQKVLDESNEFYESNLRALREWNIETNAQPLNILRTSLDDIKRLGSNVDATNIPPVSEALDAFLGRNIGEIIPVNFQKAVIPWLETELKQFNDLDVFYRDLISQGVPQREALTLVRDSVNRFVNVTSQVLGNRSQAGRLLADKSTVKMFGNLRSMMSMLENGVGRDLDEGTVMNLVDMVAKNKAAAANSNGAFNANVANAKAARQTIKDPTIGQKFSEAITNIYTSGVQTAVVNAMSPPVKMILNGIENTILTLTPGSSRFLQFRRMGATLNAMLDAFKESGFFAKSGFLEGQALDNLGDVQGAIGKNILKPSSKAEKILGETIRTIGTRPSVGIDEFFKTYFRKMELYDQFYKLAYSGKFKGRESDVYNALKKIDLKDLDWSTKLIKEGQLIPGVTERQLSSIVSEAKEYAKLNTFQADLGKLGNDLLRLKSNNPGAALIIPFVKTPLNILKDGISYTPLGLVDAFTPQRVMRTPSGKIRYTPEGKQMTQAYLSTEQRYARAAMGTAAAVAIAMHVANNEITGSYPKDAGKRAAMMAAGIPEYSIKVGDNWIPYGRIEPLATTLGLTVDGIRNVLDFYQKNPKDQKAGQLAAEVTTSLANNLANKTFLQGVAGVVQAINDPARHGSAFVKGFSSLAVPGVVAQFAKTADENVRIADTFGEAVQNRIPGMREELPIRYNLFGGAAENPTQGLAAFTGVPIRSAVQTKIQQAVADAKVDYEMPDRKIKGIELDSAQQSRYQQISDNMITMRLNALVNTQGFDNLPQGIRKNLIEKQMKQGRQIATKIMTAELSRDPEFVREMARQRIIKKSGIDIEE